jgi:hypothetical protein
LGEKKIDLLFVLDASNIITTSGFDAVKSFVKSMLIPYTKSVNFTQVGLITLATSATGQFTLSASNGATVPNLIDPVPYDGTSGQNMTAALNLLIQISLSQTQGYRVDPDTQHLVIYITSNAAYTGGDPFEQARTIRRAGTWGFASLGYGSLVGGSNNLVDLVGSERCFYPVGNPTDLNTNGLNFLQSLTCFNGRICQF